VEFASPRSALDTVFRDPPDLVIADWNTRIDGKRFATCLKLAAPAARLIIVSGDPARLIVESSEADAVLEKPFAMDALVNAVRRLVPQE
jgi:DNA-binding response OmpR family regulator